jgi:hypothetical protein
MAASGQELILQINGIAGEFGVFRNVRLLVLYKD